MVYKPCIGGEIEFYLLGKNDDVRTTIDAIQARFAVEKEKGLGQYECVVNHTFDIHGLVVQINDLREFITTIASVNSVTAVFDAKPFANDYGSALHLHLSLHDEAGDNLFAAGTIDSNILLQHSIAGILDLTREGVFLVCNSDNDYLRFVPKFMAPVKVSWGSNNRTTVIRIPDSKPQHRRIEYRLAPANCDPAKLLAIMLAGVEHGINSALVPLPRVWGNAYDSFYELEPLPSCHAEAENIFRKRGKLAELKSIFTKS